MNRGYYNGPIFGRYPVWGRRIQNGAAYPADARMNSEQGAREPGNGQNAIKDLRGSVKRRIPSENDPNSMPRSAGVSAERDGFPITELPEEQEERHLSDGSGNPRHETEDAEPVDTACCEGQQESDTDDKPECEQEEKVSCETGDAAVQTLAVHLPGSKTPVRFCAVSLPESGVKYVPEASEAVITIEGSYRLRFSLSISSRVAAPAAFIAEVNKAKLPGGVFAVFLRAGLQDWSGEVLAPLNEGDSIKLVFSSVSPVRIELVRSDIPAGINIERLTEEQGV